MPIDYIPQDVRTPVDEDLLIAGTDKVLANNSDDPANKPHKITKDNVQHNYLRTPKVGSYLQSGAHYLNHKRTTPTTPIITPSSGTINLDAASIMFWDRGAPRQCPATAACLSFTNTSGATQYYQIYVEVDTSDHDVYNFTAYAKTTTTDIDTDLLSYAGAYLGYLTLANGAMAGDGTFTECNNNDAFPMSITPKTLTVSNGDTTGNFITTASINPMGGASQPACFSTEKLGPTTDVTLKIYALDYGFFNYKIVNTGV